MTLELRSEKQMDTQCVRRRWIFKLEDAKQEQREGSYVWSSETMEKSEKRHS